MSDAALMLRCASLPSFFTCIIFPGPRFPVEGRRVGGLACHAYIGGVGGKLLQSCVACCCYLYSYEEAHDGRFGTLDQSERERDVYREFRTVQTFRSDLCLLHWVSSSASPSLSRCCVRVLPVCGLSQIQLLLRRRFFFYFSFLFLPSLLPPSARPLQGARSLSSRMPQPLALTRLSLRASADSKRVGDEDGDEISRATDHLAVIRC
jgi:hypothetical protein